MDAKKHNERYREYKTKWQKKWRKKNPQKALRQATKDFNNWKKRNPLRYKAHKIVFVEKRAGRLKKENCQICGTKYTHAHHSDYSKPLSVIWLCRKHHLEHHRKKKK